MYFISVEAYKFLYISRRFRMSRNEHGGFHSLHHIQCFQIGSHVVNERNSILLQRFLAADTVRKEYHPIRHTELTLERTYLPFTSQSRIPLRGCCSSSQLQNASSMGLSFRFRYSWSCS